MPADVLAPGGGLNIGFNPEEQGATIACEARLTVNIDKLTELAIIRLKEH